MGPARHSPREEEVVAGHIDRDRRDAEDEFDPVTERAQPGDILGIEHEGETTNLGDTPRDEIKRLRDTEDDVRKDRERER